MPVTSQNVNLRLLEMCSFGALATGMYCLSLHRNRTLPFMKPISYGMSTFGLLLFQLARNHRGQEEIDEPGGIEKEIDEPGGIEKEIDEPGGIEKEMDDHRGIEEEMDDHRGIKEEIDEHRGIKEEIVIIPVFSQNVNLRVFEMCSFGALATGMFCLSLHRNRTLPFMKPISYGISTFGLLLFQLARKHRSKAEIDEHRGIKEEIVVYDETPKRKKRIRTLSIPTLQEQVHKAIRMMKEVLLMEDETPKRKKRIRTLSSPTLQKQMDEAILMVKEALQREEDWKSDKDIEYWKEESDYITAEIDKFLTRLDKGERAEEFGKRIRYNLPYCPLVKCRSVDEGLDEKKGMYDRWLSYQKSKYRRRRWSYGDILNKLWRF